MKFEKTEVLSELSKIYIYPYRNLVSVILNSRPMLLAHKQKSWGRVCGSEACKV